MSEVYVRGGAPTSKSARENREAATAAAGGAGWRPKPAGRTGRGRFNENNARPAPARVLPLGLGGWVCEKLEPTSRRLRQKRVPSCARTEAPARARATLYSRGVNCSQLLLPLLSHFSTSSFTFLHLFSSSLPSFTFTSFNIVNFLSPSLAFFHLIVSPLLIFFRIYVLFFTQKMQNNTHNLKANQFHRNFYSKHP